MAPIRPPKQPRPGLTSPPPPARFAYYCDEIRREPERWMRIQFARNQQILTWLLSAFAQRRIMLVATDDIRRIMLQEVETVSILTVIASGIFPEGAELTTNQIKSIEVYIRFLDVSATHELEGVLQSQRVHVKNVFVRPTLPYRAGGRHQRVQDAVFA